jgi:hypothetical protein
MGDMQEVGTFHQSYNTWSGICSLIDSSGIDISDDINQQLSRSGGEALLNVSIENSPCTFSDVFGAITAGLCFFFPFCADVPYCQTIEITGTIVKRRPIPAARVGTPRMQSESRRAEGSSGLF